jgi:hypothetical protein
MTKRMIDDKPKEHAHEAASFLGLVVKRHVGQRR